MNNFSTIYRILKTIDTAMDYANFDGNSISPETLGITQERWNSIVYELIRSEYIAGIECIPVMGQTFPAIRILKPRLTIKGMEYLVNNEMMKKAEQLAKGIN